MLKYIVKFLYTTERFKSNSKLRPLLCFSLHFVFVSLFGFSTLLLVRMRNSFVYSCFMYIYIRAVLLGEALHVVVIV